MMIINGFLFVFFKILLYFIYILMAIVLYTNFCRSTRLKWGFRVHW